MLEQSKELNFEGQNIYVGIDVHLKSWSVSVMTEYSHYKTFSQDPKPEILVNYLHRNFPGATYHSAYEAGFCGLWAHYKLMELGVKSIVVNPADVPTTQKEMVHKTDPTDSKKIAKALRNGVLVPIYIPKPTTLELRSLLRVRTNIMRNYTRFRNRLKHFLYFHGIELPEQFNNPVSHWTKRFVKWLMEDVHLESKNGQDAFDLLVREAEEQRKILLLATGKLRKLIQQEEYVYWVKLLRGIPGIGMISSLTFLAEIEDIRRFPSNDKLAGYVGLIPSCHASGENDYKGEITMRGHNVLRTLIIECAWVAIREDPALQLSYCQYCKRMESNKAITRIARKLLNRIYYVLKNEKEYILGVVQ